MENNIAPFPPLMANQCWTFAACDASCAFWVLLLVGVVTPLLPVALAMADTMAGKKRFCVIMVDAMKE